MSQSLESSSSSAEAAQDSGVPPTDEHPEEEEEQLEPTDQDDEEADRDRNPRRNSSPEHALEDPELSDEDKKESPPKPKGKKSSRGKIPKKPSSELSGDQEGALGSIPSTAAIPGNGRPLRPGRSRNRNSSAWNPSRALVSRPRIERQSLADGSTADIVMRILDSGVYPDERMETKMVGSLLKYFREFASSLRTSEAKCELSKLKGRLQEEYYLQYFQLQPKLFNAVIVLDVAIDQLKLPNWEDSLSQMVVDLLGITDAFVKLSLARNNGSDSVDVEVTTKALSLISRLKNSHVQFEDSFLESDMH